MRTIDGLKNIPHYRMPSVVAIGFFDGVHRGHQSVIKRAVRHAMRKRAQSVVITFNRHPLETVKPGSHPPILTDTSSKANLIESLRVDLLVVIRFTKKFSQLSPVEFLDKICGLINVKEVVVGENFHFGKNGAGNVEFLEKYGKEHNFEVVCVPLVKRSGEAISSTRIRSLLKNGKIKEVRDILGYFPLIHGGVVEGNKRGRLLGFRTANIETDNKAVVPGEGVYAGHVLFHRKKRKCVISIGTTPTFSGTKSLMEVHILNFNDNIYGEPVELEFIDKIREQFTFKDEETLIAQIKQDIKKAESILESK